MVTQTIPRQSNRDQYIQSLKEFIAGIKSPSDLVNSCLMEELGSPVSALGYNEETELCKEKFDEAYAKVTGLLEGLADPISEKIPGEVEMMHAFMRETVEEAGNSMFDTIISGQVPFLKDLTARLEATGDAQ